MIGAFIAGLFAPDPAKVEARRRAEIPGPSRTIDYRNGKRGWGHDISIEADPDNPGDAVGHMFASSRVTLGDHVLWSTEYGHARARIVKHRRPMDPGDMHFVTLEIVMRVDREGNLLPAPGSES